MDVVLIPCNLLALANSDLTQNKILKCIQWCFFLHICLVNWITRCVEGSADSCPQGSDTASLVWVPGMANLLHPWRGASPCVRLCLASCQAYLPQQGLPGPKFTSEQTHGRSHPGLWIWGEDMQMSSSLDGVLHTGAALRGLSSRMTS